MPRAVDQIDQILLLAHLVFDPPVHREVQRDGGAFHRDAPRLLVGPAVEVADLAGHFGGDDAVGGDEGVRQRGLAVVDVREDADVADVGRGVVERGEGGGVDGGHFGGGEGKGAGH